jgi:hypothetical protein
VKRQANGKHDPAAFGKGDAICRPPWYLTFTDWLQIQLRPLA